MRQPLPPLDTMPVDFGLLSRYRTLTAAAQLELRRAVAQHGDWSAEDLRAYRLALYQSDAFAVLDPRFTAPGPGHVYQVGETPGVYGEDVARAPGAYNLDMIRRYRLLSDQEQLRVRWAVATKASWTAEERRAYRVAMYQNDPSFQLDPRTTAVGPFHASQVGELSGAYEDPAFPHGRWGSGGTYLPADAAAAFARLGRAMGRIASEATRAGDSLVRMRLILPPLSGDPAADAGTLATHFATRRTLPS